MVESLGVIIAHLRGLRDKQMFGRSKLAAIIIQCFVRQCLARMKLEFILIESASKTSKDSIIPQMIQSEFSKNSSTCIISLWWRLTLAQVIFEKITRIIFVRRIQRNWRLVQRNWRLKRERSLHRQKHLLNKTCCWMKSIAALYNNELRRQFKGAFVIQRMWRQRQAWNMIYRCICKEQEEIRSTRIALLQIALFLQSRWRSKICQRLLIRKRKDRSLCLAKIHAATKLQSCYRRLKSIRILRLKRETLYKWQHLVKYWLQRQRAFALKEIHSEFHQQRLIDRRLKAASTFAFALGNIFRKQQLEKRQRRDEEKLAALRLQTWWRMKSSRFPFLTIIASVGKIQRSWRVTRYRRLLMKVYRAERSRKSIAFSIEKKDLCERRIERQIVALFAKTKHRAAHKIQSYFRHYLIRKQNEEELRLQKELEKEKRANEEARLNEIIRRKQEAKKTKTITKTYMKRVIGKVSRSVHSVASLEIFQGIKSQRRESSERRNVAPELLHYDMLRRTRKGTKAIPHNAIVSNYRNTLQQMFGNSQWFDRKCEIIMFRYLLWPDEILSLRRLVHYTEMFPSLWLNVFNS